MRDPTEFETPRVMDWKMVVSMDLSLQSPNKQQLSTQLMKAFQSLNIQPILLERIVEAIEQTVDRAKLKIQPAPEQRAVHVRIWSSVARRNSGGWGFFLVERPRSVCQQPGEKTTNIVDLFLYQE